MSAATPHADPAAPEYQDTGCRFASSCFHCHLAICAESPEGTGEAVILQRILAFSGRAYEGKAGGAPPALPEAPRRRRRHLRKPLDRPATVAASARRLEVSVSKWYRLFHSGAIPPALVPENPWRRLRPEQGHDPRGP